MFLFTPMYAPLLLALIPQKWRGLRVFVMIVGLVVSIVMVVAAFHYGMEYQKNRRARSGGRLIIRTKGGWKAPAPEGTAPTAGAEDAWDRDAGAL